MWGVENWGELVWGMAAPAVPLVSPVGWMVLGGLLAATGTRVLRGRRNTAFLAITTVLIIGPLAVWAGSLDVPNTFTNGTIADADAVNGNFAAVETSVDDNDARINQLSALFGTNTSGARSGNGSVCTIGAVWLTAGAVAGGYPAYGQILQISGNETVFSLMGTTYGGDGRLTFGLPDLRDAAPSGLTYVICLSGVYPSSN
jgi:hypothetical protein